MIDRAIEQAGRQLEMPGCLFTFEVARVLWRDWICHRGFRNQPHTGKGSACISVWGSRESPVSPLETSTVRSLCAVLVAEKVSSECSLELVSDLNDLVGN